MYIALRLLRDGAHTTITTRFPKDAARRFASMPDSAEWLRSPEHRRHRPAPARPGRRARRRGRRRRSARHPHQQRRADRARSPDAYALLDRRRGGRASRRRPDVLELGAAARSAPGDRRSRLDRPLDGRGRRRAGARRRRPTTAGPSASTTSTPSRCSRSSSATRRRRSSSSAGCAPRWRLRRRGAPTSSTCRRWRAASAAATRAPGIRTRTWRRPRSTCSRARARVRCWRPTASS